MAGNREAVTVLLTRSMTFQKVTQATALGGGGKRQELESIRTILQRKGNGRGRTGYIQMVSLADSKDMYHEGMDVWGRG